MRWSSMLGEDMDDEKFSQLGRGDSIVSQNEESLLIESKIFVVRELLDKVHRDRFPRTEWNRKLTEKAIWFMSFCF
jgi:hypothetical protein